MKNYIIVTGGAGFVGSNLIEKLLNKTNKQIISIDNYSSGSRKNHFKNKKVKYIKSDIKNIHKVLYKYKKNIHSLFHFRYAWQCPTLPCLKTKYHWRRKA